MGQPEVTIRQGKLRGSIGTDFRGTKFCKFQGIPYARAPLGELRFKAPCPPDKWTGIFDASKEGNVSYAKDPFKRGAISGSENCLFLNVFTKKLPDGKNTELHPVLFWIHGGGFAWGSGNEDMYGPEFLITEDVVLVTINYRLGLLGFLGFEDPALDVPGNAGFKDQVQALKWVKKNISKFGGDPNNVTIFGGSAGGACVHLLMLSPLGKGLFHRAIAQSGCALNPFVRGARSSQLLAKVLKLEGADDKSIYNCLMEKSVEEVYEIQRKMSDKLLLASRRREFGLVIEKDSNEAFLSEEPLEIIKSGNFNRVPFMLGYVTAEGTCLEFTQKRDSPEIPAFEDMVPYFFEYQFGSAEAKAAAEKIKKFYFGDEKYSQKSASKKYDMWGDCHIIHGIYLTVVYHITVSKTPIYLYRISLETNLNFLKKLLKIQIPGVSHGDDEGYLFKNFTTPKINYGSFEDISIRKFVKLWTNFGKFAHPTPKGNDELLKVVWKPVTGPNLNFLDIGTDLVPKSNPEPERMRFWTKLYSESPAGLNIRNLYLVSSL